MHPLALLFKFLKNPSTLLPNLDSRSIIKHLFAYVFFGLTLSVGTIGLISILAPSNAVDNVSPKLTVNTWAEGWNIIISAVVFAPIIEEFLFRGPISKAGPIFRKICFAIGLFLLLFFLQSMQITATRILGFNKFAFLMAAVVIGVAVPLLINNKVYTSNKFTNGLVYFQAILFALFHVNNTNFGSAFAYILAPFLILNQLYLGFVCGLVAKNYGYIRAVMLHMINNFIAVFFLVALSVNDNTPLRIILGILAASAYLFGCWAFLDETFVYYKNRKKEIVDIRLV
jgi:Type II CAAX prenyl endopeptidase Rce1-like